jgi:ankyrin repeat protein
LEESPELVNAVGPHPFWGGRPQPLHVAIETNRRDMFDLLLEHGADANGTNDQYDHWSPLMIAIHGGREEMRDELIRRGARIGLPEALLLGDDRGVDQLLKNGALVRAPVPNNGSLLSFARTVYAIDRLIASGVPAELNDKWGTKPIQALSRLGPTGAPLVRRLVEHGARASAIEYARLGDQSALAALLESNPAEVRADAVFMAAIEAGHIELARWLLSVGANVNARSDGFPYRTALHAAAWNGDLPMVQLLVAAGADVKATDAEHHTTPRDWAMSAVTIRNNPNCQRVADYLAGLERPVNT